jgi:hypothetical protein
MPLLAYGFKLDEVLDLEWREIDAWLEAIEVYELEKENNRMRVLPFANVQYKDGGRLMQSMLNVNEKKIKIKTGNIEVVPTPKADVKYVKKHRNGT